jgi:hypothetical protein
MSGSGRPIGIGGPQVKVRVTEHDIAWAVRDDSSRCMVARALARELPDAARIEVDTQTIRFTTHKGRFAYLTPLMVQRYVAAFDAAEPIEPFEFMLRNPMQLKRRVFSQEEKDAERLRRMTEEKSQDVMKGGVHHTATLPKKQPKETKEGHRGPPRVFKTRSRTYGHRVLRINQPMQSTALDEVPAE